jgi:serine/threonine-protein kinase
MTTYLSSVHAARWYRLIQTLGAGAFGNVYECEVVLSNGIAVSRRFAVKVLRDTNDAENLRRFAREAHLLRGLKHPNLIRAVEINLSHDPPYFIIELMQETLDTRLQRMLSQNTVYRAKPALESVLLPLCKGVAHLHFRNIYHRDIKPANIYFDSKDNPVLGDFGICNERRLWSAKLTWCGLGTAWYTAPETLQSGVASPQSDIFSLGIVLYEMLTGCQPWGYWWNYHSNRPSVQHPRSCHQFVDDFLIKMTHPEPSMRYSTVGSLMPDMLHLIRAHLPGMPAYQPAAPPRILPQLRYQPLASRL